MLSKHPAHAQNLREVRQAVDHRVSLLASRLAADLSSASLLSQTYLRSHIQYLLALGLQEQAREIYLHTRSFTLKEVVRKLKFEGDIVGYIQRLSSAVFRFLTDTGKYYIATFAEQHLSSGYVLWASQELEEYAAIFRRYVFYNHSFRVVVDCLRIVAKHCVEFRDTGYDMLYFIEQTFHEDICGALDAYRKRTETTIVKLVNSDRWVPAKEKRRDMPDGNKARVSVTSSVIEFEELVYHFMEDVEDIYSINLYVPIVAYLTSTFEKMLRQLQEISKAKMLRDGQVLAIVENAVYVTDFLFTKITADLKKRFERDVPELDKLRRRLEAVEGALVESYVKRRAEDLSNLLLDAAEGGFRSKKNKHRETDKPDFISNAMDKVIDTMRVFSVDAGPGIRDRVMTPLVLQLVTILTEVPFERSSKFSWTTYSVHQLLLDFYVLIKVFESPAPAASPLIAKELERAMEKVIKGYQRPKKRRSSKKTGGGEDDTAGDDGEAERPLDPVEPAEWFTQLAQTIVKELCNGLTLDQFWIKFEADRDPAPSAPAAGDTTSTAPVASSTTASTTSSSQKAQAPAAGSNPFDDDDDDDDVVPARAPAKPSTTSSASSKSKK